MKDEDDEPVVKIGLRTIYDVVVAQDKKIDRLIENNASSQTELRSLGSRVSDLEITSRAHQAFHDTSKTIWRWIGSMSALAVSGLIVWWFSTHP